jgi:hypothetical protein
VADLECTGDFDRVVSSLRMTHEDKGTGLAGGPVTQDLGDRRRPIQMPAHLRIDPPRLQFVGEAVQAAREYAEPAAQEEHPGLGRGCAVAPEQGNGDDGTDPPHGRSRPELVTGIAHRPKAEMERSHQPPERIRGVMTMLMVFHSLYLSFGSSA